MNMSRRHQACYPLSSVQLREMWDYDNRCASEIMHIPLRRCSKIETEFVTDRGGVSPEEFQLMKQCVKTMWERASTVLEFFSEEGRPDLGFRLRVRESLLINIKFLERVNVILGWTAAAPGGTSLCAHLYNRSPIEKQGYLGGPLSYLNWNGKFPNVTVIRSYKGPESYLVHVKSLSLKPGVELLWDYGSPATLPDCGEWYLSGQCCSTVFGQRRAKRVKRLVDDFKFTHKECCVLCGKPFSVSEKGRVQKKPHFIDSHADFLGSDWDGINPFIEQEEDEKLVDGGMVLIQADILNNVLANLSRLKWNVIPACNVFSTKERNELFPSPKKSKVMTEFRMRCEVLRKAGTLVLRGTSIPTAFEHLQPIAPSKWGTLTWKRNTQPKRGHYGLPQELKEEREILSEDVQQYLLQILAVQSESDEESDLHS